MRVRAGGCRDAVVPVSELRISLQVAAAAAAATHRGLYTLHSTVCCSVITPPRVTPLRDNTVTLVTRGSGVKGCHECHAVGW